MFFSYSGSSLMSSFCFRSQKRATLHHPTDGRQVIPMLLSQNKACWSDIISSNQQLINAICFTFVLYQDVIDKIITVLSFLRCILLMDKK